MTTTHHYTFDNLSRIGNDLCGISERDKQNSSYGTYNTTNYFMSDCGMKKSIQFATTQPNINFKGGHLGAGGCNVDVDSNVKIGTIQSNPKCRISLQQRPFATVPYLGRGASYPITESQLQQGAPTKQIRSCNRITEVSYGNEKVPMIPSVKANIQNPVHLIESDAADGWIRGGLPTRDLAHEYL
tara:strand:+ start:99 stop:653 length:555 start_codon:yes stop_codon:yes gene_type:complete